MPERRPLICTCGYTTLVSNSSFGKPVKCQNCGAELKADGPSAAPALETGHDEGLPESPFAAHGPFEEETQRGEAHPERPEDPTPQPRARSPFEDDDTEEQELTRLSAPSRKSWNRLESREELGQRS